MAFLFHDQNQGIRNDAPRTIAAVATVLFHPDSNRRLRNRTESADPFHPGDFRENKALAGLGLSPLTAGGEFHPALRTTAAQYERPAGSMAKRGRAIKNLRQGNPYFLITKAIAG